MTDIVRHFLVQFITILINNCLIVFYFEQFFMKLLRMDKVLDTFSFLHMEISLAYRKNFIQPKNPIRLPEYNYKSEK